MNLIDLYHHVSPILPHRETLTLIGMGYTAALIQWRLWRRRPPLRDARDTVARCVQSYQDEQARVEARVVAAEQKSLCKALPRDLQGIVNAERVKSGEWIIHVPGFQPVKADFNFAQTATAFTPWWNFNGKRADIRAVLVATAKEPELPTIEAIKAAMDVDRAVRESPVRDKHYADALTYAVTAAAPHPFNWCNTADWINQHVHAGHSDKCGHCYGAGFLPLTATSSACHGSTDAPRLMCPHCAGSGKAVTA